MANLLLGMWIIAIRSISIDTNWIKCAHLITLVTLATWDCIHNIREQEALIENLTEFEYKMIRYVDSATICIANIWTQSTSRRKLSIPGCYEYDLWTFQSICIMLYLLFIGSGWWGWSRHAHYTTEFGTFICWTLLTNTRQWLPYFPLLFLLLLLIDRMYRDEMRCLAKYGQCWLQYCNRVPYLLLPGFI
jgi:hypothetical protein